jgi:MerR family transcriptional regulator, copper efflux regulator
LPIPEEAPVMRTTGLEAFVMFGPFQYWCRIMTHYLRCRVTPQSRGAATVLIGEIAKMSGLSKDGLRHYEEMGLISSVPREAGSKIYRDYDPSVLETIERIRDAQRLGFSLKEIGPLLKAYAEHPPSKEQTTEFLEARLIVVREKIASLREVENYICQKLDRYRDAKVVPATAEVVRRPSRRRPAH